MCLDFRVFEDDGVHDADALVDLRVGADTHIRAEYCTGVDISCGVDEAVPEDLVILQVVWPSQKLRTDLAVVLEIGILASELVLMAGDIPEELPRGWVNDECVCFLWPSGAQYHKHIPHLDSLFMLLPQPASLPVGMGESTIPICCCVIMQKV